MFIKGPNIYLRAVEPSDADLLYRWENDRSVWAVSGLQSPLSRFVLDDFVNAAHQDIYTNKQLRLMVGLVNNNETVGVVDLFEFDPRNDRCGLGILIHSGQRKNGLGAECLQLIRDYAFTTLHLRQLFADVAESNTASLALFEKCGYTKCGLKKQWQKTALGQYEDVWLLQLLNPETPQSA